MPYDEHLAERVRAVLAAEDAITEQSMFGGLAFLAGGHMAVAVSGQGGLMVRVAPEDAEGLLRDGVVTRMVMGGREMAGWLRVTADGADTKRQLEPWVRRGVALARTLPPKTAGGGRRRRRTG